MTAPEVVRVLGIQERTITKHVKAHGFEFSYFQPGIREELIAQKVIPIGAGRPPRFIPREAIESLVRFISTPETDAIYAQLWEVARAVQSGDMETAQAISQGEPLDIDDLAVINANTMLRLVAEKKALAQALEVEQATTRLQRGLLEKRDAEILSIHKNAVSHAVAQSYMSWQIVRNYPDAVPLAYEYVESLSKYRGILAANPNPDSAVMTIWLREVQMVHEDERDPHIDYKSKKGPTGLFNRSTIDKLMAGLGLEKKGSL
jgi:hypothetical protein